MNLLGWPPGRREEATDVRALRQRLAKAERALRKAHRESGKDPSPCVVELDYSHARILLETPTKVARKRALACAKEPFTIAWLESLPAGEVLFDVGANVGAYGLVGALRPQGALRVVAFEPAYPTYALLCANVARNGVCSNVSPLPIALGDRTGLSDFPLRDLRGGAALHAAGQAVYVQPAVTARADELVHSWGLPAPAHVKLDTDGTELAVLRGMGDLLVGVHSVLVELSREDDAGVDTLLRSAGLQCADTYRPQHDYWYALYRRA
jgi:FkbM family methyltransferase